MVADTIYLIIVVKYQKYTSILILKHANFLAEGIKSHDVRLYNIMLYKKCTVLKTTSAQ